MTEQKKASWTRLPLAVLIGLGIGLVTGGAGAGYVWWQGQQELAAAQDQIEQVKAASERALQEHKKALDAELQKGVDRTVRIELARALDELDRRNFGSVTDRLKSAQAALGKATGPVQEAAKNLDSMKIGSADVEAGREDLLDMIRRVDEALK